MSHRIDSWASSEAVRRSMRSNKGRDTGPELVVRRQLHALGLRYRVNYRLVPVVRRTADIVFTRARLAVFIDGCFWHGCAEHYQRPVSNREFWDAKLVRNQQRDRETDELLGRDGWLVLRFWEHQVRSAPIEIVSAITEELAAIGGSSRQSP